MRRADLTYMLGRRILFLSPHADDVAYSIGGIVARIWTTADLHLITVFGVSGWALPRENFGSCVGGISLARKQEDRAYCARWGINYEALSCFDSAAVGYDTATELSTLVYDDSRAEAVIDLIRTKVSERNPDIVFAPCGIGGHVEHLIVRQAVDDLHDVEVLYYEDIPYSSKLSLSKLETLLSGQGLMPALTADIESVLKRKCADMWSYRTQTTLSTINGMLVHSARVGANIGRYAERIWCRQN